MGVAVHKPQVVAFASFFVPNVQQSCDHSSYGLEPKPISYSDDVGEAVEGDLFCLASKVMVGSCRWGVVSDGEDIFYWNTLRNFILSSK